MSVLKKIRRQVLLQVFALSGLAFLVVFNYIPMFGILMAFKRYSITYGIAGIFTSPWIGLEHFREFVNDYKFVDVVRNTLAISFLKIIFTFPAPILLALMLNEIRISGIKRFVQTVSYLPHFISWVIVAGIAGAFFSESRGVVNVVLMNFRLIERPLAILSSPDYFYGLTVFTAVWKSTGWWSIIFLAAIAGIDPSLYESAEIDGAGRLKKIWYITLPSMKGAVVVVLILTIGSLLGGGLVGSNFEQAFLLGNPMNNSRSEIIQTYAFRTGLVYGRFAYATAIDLLQSAISVILVFTSNFIAKKTTETALFE